jgi:hypothetical protein
MNRRKEPERVGDGRSESAGIMYVVAVLVGEPTPVRDGGIEASRPVKQHAVVDEMIKQHRRGRSVLDEVDGGERTGSSLPSVKVVDEFGDLSACDGRREKRDRRHSDQSRRREIRCPIPVPDSRARFPTHVSAIAPSHPVHAYLRSQRQCFSERFQSSVARRLAGIHDRCVAAFPARWVQPRALPQ